MGNGRWRVQAVISSVHISLLRKSFPLPRLFSIMSKVQARCDSAEQCLFSGTDVREELEVTSKFWLRFIPYLWWRQVVRTMTGTENGSTVVGIRHGLEYGKWKLCVKPLGRTIRYTQLMILREWARVLHPISR